MRTLYGVWGMHGCRLHQPTSQHHPFADGEICACLQVGIWRCGETRYYKRNYNGKTRQHRAGDPFFKDLNVNAKFYVKLLKTKLLPCLVELRSSVWDQANGSKDYDLHIQHDGAPGHKSHGVEEMLTEIFSTVRGKFVRQPAKSPCTNMLDMAVFHSL